MNALVQSPAYTALLAKVPPRVIRSDAQHEAYLQTLSEMEERHGSWSPDEAELADLLTLLIEDYEEKHFSLPRSSPQEAIAFLMQQHGLVEKDLVDIFHTVTAATQVLRGHKDLDREQIQKLSQRFHVSPELFF